MADTGERRQISGRAKANEAETIRSSRKLIATEQSRTDTNNAAFSTGANDRRASKGNKSQSGKKRS